MEKSFILFAVLLFWKSMNEKVVVDLAKHLSSGGLEEGGETNKVLRSAYFS